MTSWLDNAEELKICLRSLSVRDGSGLELDPDAAFQQWRDLGLLIRETGKTVYLIGNGASASMASHIAADLAKNAGIHTEVFSDLSLMTAIANDFGYEDVFAEPLRRRMAPGDMLVAVSSSGNSPNILRATEAANSLGGLTVTLSSLREDNRLRSSGMLNFYVKGSTYGMAESCHAAILHYWVDLTCAEKFPESLIMQDQTSPPLFQENYQLFPLPQEPSFGARSNAVVPE